MEKTYICPLCKKIGSTFRSKTPKCNHNQDEEGTPVPSCDMDVLNLEPGRNTFKNLAGNDSADTVIIKELYFAGIDTYYGKYSGEVPYSIIGKMITDYGIFSFTRAWKYWVVDCMLPLEQAKLLYEHRVAKMDIRAGGHCGCVSPEEVSRLYDNEGRKLISESEKGKPFVDELITEHPDKYRFGSDGLQFVTTYHIDTQEGLLLFTEFVKGNLIIKPNL